MKKLALAVAMLALSTNAFAADEWTKTNTALQGIYTVLHVIDWGQTLEAARNPVRYTSVEYNGVTYHPSSYQRNEKNLLLGKNPSVATVNTYFATTLIGHAAVSYALPSKWREAWQAAGIGLELYVTVDNYRAGLSGFF